MYLCNRIVTVVACRQTITKLSVPKPETCRSLLDPAKKFFLDVPGMAYSTSPPFEREITAKLLRNC